MHDVLKNDGDNEPDDFYKSTIETSVNQNVKYTSTLDQIDPKEVRVLYVATIVLVITAIAFFILGF